MREESERKRIRHKIKDILKGSNLFNDVFSFKSTASSAENLPIAIIYGKNESIERNDESPKLYQRSYQVTVEIETVNDTDDLVSDELDDLCFMVERLIEQSDIRDIKKDDGECIVNDFDLVSVAYDTEGNGEAPIGSVIMIYNFVYYTNEDLSSDLKDFKSMSTEYRINGQTESNAKDIANFEE